MRFSLRTLVNDGCRYAVREPVFVFALVLTIIAAEFFLAGCAWKADEIWAWNVANF